MNRTLLSLGALCLGAAIGLAACGGTTVVERGDGGAGGEGSATSTTATATTATTTTTSTSATTGTGVDPQMPECTSDADCQLVNDCCSCVGIGPGEPAPGCDIEDCFAPTCDALGFPMQTARCAAGHCVADFPCNQNDAACDSPTPSCEPGHTPTVLGACWGPCVLASECGSVTSCSDCDAAGQLCVVDETQQGSVFHCVVLPPVCQGSPDCACMGASVCVDPYNACFDAPGQVSCSCLDC